MNLELIAKVGQKPRLVDSETKEEVENVHSLRFLYHEGTGCVCWVELEVDADLQVEAEVVQRKRTKSG